MRRKPRRRSTCEGRVEVEGRPVHQPAAEDDAVVGHPRVDRERGEAGVGEPERHPAGDAGEVVAHRAVDHEHGEAAPARVASRGRKIIPSQLCPSSVEVTTRSIARSRSSSPKSGRRRPAAAGDQRHYTRSRSQEVTAVERRDLVPLEASARIRRCGSTVTSRLPAARATRGQRDGLLEAHDLVAGPLHQQDRRPHLADLAEGHRRGRRRAARVPPGAVGVDLAVGRAARRPAALLDHEEAVVLGRVGVGADRAPHGLGRARRSPASRRSGRPAAASTGAGPTGCRGTPGRAGRARGGWRRSGWRASRRWSSPTG